MTPSARPSRPTLTHRPEVRVFRDERELDAALARITKHTLVTPVTSRHQLYMNPQGLVRGQFRYTSQGLKQVLSIACARAYEAVCDLAGAVRRPRDDREEYSLTAAVDVYNMIVERRFRRFCDEVRLLINLEDKTIEGVLGPRFELLENSVLLEKAREAVASAARPAKFQSATLIGRRVAIRFAHVQPLVEYAGDVFRGGYHFSNSETGGEATVRAAVILQREATGSVSMGKFLGGKLVHTGRDFQAKLARMFGAAAAVEQSPKMILAQLTRLGETPLGFSRDGDRQKHEAKVASALQQGNVPKNLALRVVQSALCYGSDPRRDAPPRPLGRATLERRTAYDLYNSLTDAGAALYATSREAVEQAAHQLLAGRIYPT